MQPKRITRARPPVDPPLTGWVIGIWRFVDQAAVGEIGKLAIGRWKYLRVLSTIEGRMEWKIDKMIGVASSVIRMLCQSKGKAVASPSDLHSYPHLWPQALGSEVKNEMPDTHKWQK